MEEVKKEYSNEMRGSLWTEENRTNEKAPTATGTITIAGVELRIAMWPARVAGGSGKGAGKKFWPIAVEYKQGARRFLVPIEPKDVTATAASAQAASAPGAAVENPDDMPF